MAKARKLLSFLVGVSTFECMCSLGDSDVDWIKYSPPIYQYVMAKVLPEELG